MTEIYEWDSYIQGPRWVNLRKIMWEAAFSYGCELIKWETEKSFLSQVSFFTISGPEQNIKVLQTEIFNNPRIHRKAI